jgi:hypothetical protein
MDSIKTLIEYVHFNKNKPEYHNIYIPNIKEKKYAKVFDGHNWNIVKNHNIISHLINDACQSIENFIDNDNNKTKTLMNNEINKLLEIANDEIQPKYNEIKEDVRMLLYNKRKMVENTIKSSN